MFDIENTIITAIAILFVLVTHEFAHGIVAYWNGDNTAKSEGRLTLNPLKHLDPMGTIAMVLFRFGWAKPVPVNFLNFKNKRFGMFTVAIAGVTINILTAFIAILILPSIASYELLSNFVSLIAFYGILFAIFNLIPIPPLDGSKVLASLLPYKFSYYMFRYENRFYPILLVLLATGFISKFISPIVSQIFRFFIDISINLRMIL